MRPITGARASCPRLPHEGISRGGFLEETSSFLHSHTLLPLIFPTSRVEHFSGARGVCHIPNRAPHTATEMMEIENLFRYAALAVGLKPSARRGEARLRGLYRIIFFKDHKPSAIQGEARLRGRERNISSKTILSVPFESTGCLGVTLSAHERQQPGWDRQQPGQQQR